MIEDAARCRSRPPPGRSPPRGRGGRRDRACRACSPGSPPGSGSTRRAAVNLTAIVTTADDGGSSGELRRGYGVPAPGDVRNCLVALAEGREPARLAVPAPLRGGGGSPVTRWATSSSPRSRSGSETSAGGRGRRPAPRRPRPGAPGVRRAWSSSSRASRTGGSCGARRRYRARGGRVAELRLARPAGAAGGVRRCSRPTWSCSGPGQPLLERAREPARARPARGAARDRHDARPRREPLHPAGRDRRLPPPITCARSSASSATSWTSRSSTAAAAPRRRRAPAAEAGRPVEVDRAELEELGRSGGPDLLAPGTSPARPAEARARALLGIARAR